VEGCQSFLQSRIICLLTLLGFQQGGIPFLQSFVTTNDDFTTKFIPFFL
jgi:hypothetical protein